jgi:hypothetical protein
MRTQAEQIRWLESGLSLIPLMGRTWAPKGCTPTIRRNSQWELSAIAGITLDRSLHFRVHDGSIRSEQIIEYMEQLLRHIYLRLQLHFIRKMIEGTASCQQGYGVRV